MAEVWWRVAATDIVVAMTHMLDLPDALSDAGVEVRLLDGWDTFAQAGYDWREADGNPAGAMWHHTATASYTPNRDKANGWAGIGYHDTDRLYQEDYGDGFPVYTIANAYPAPISSGYGVRSVLEDWVKRDIPFTGRQTEPDSATWAGNTHYWNTEVVLDGVGSKMETSVWDMLVTIGEVLNDLMGWTPARHVAHAHHTRRKIDLRDGRFADADATIQALREDMTVDENCPWHNTTDPSGPWYTHYGKCDKHFDAGQPLEWGRNTGVCNVPSWGEESVLWGISERIILVADNGRDDFDNQLTDGRYWVFEYRANG